ncbi:MAG TPA: RNA 2',3'-cyclic phosphodiesterase [Williamwhitmania sp.]|nr:RNA 2',3'-cyclic phosphodiesterase [Williamwhitmania sp.]
MEIHRNTTETLRTFIGVKIEENQQLTDLVSGLKARLSGKPIKWVSPHNYHITLRFLGSTTPEQVSKIYNAINAIVSSHKAFMLTLSGIGNFGRPDAPAVLWAGVEKNDNLEVLAAVIETLVREVGFPEELKPFAPHLTLARPKGNGYADIVKELENEFSKISLGKFTISSIFLYKSVHGQGGPIYLPIFEIPLL